MLSPIRSAVERLRRGEIAKAIEDCRQIPSGHPTYGKAQHLLGVCLIRAGDLAEAVAVLRGALCHAPRDVDVLLNLALAQRETKDLAGAIVTLESVLQISPDHAAAHNNLGINLQELERPEDALIHFKQAATLAPNRQDYQRNLASLLDTLGKQEEALSVYLKILDQTPGNHVVHVQAGKIIAKHDPGRAIDHFKQALAIKPDFSQAHLSIAQQMGILGQFEEAETHLRQVIGLSPERAEAYRQLLHIRPLSAQDETLATQVSELLDAENLDASARTDLHFALGKYHDTRAEYTEAFEHYRIANAIVKKEQNFEAQEFREYIDSLIASFTPQYFTSRTGGSDSSKPIIVCGLPRSGTTLVEQILASHHQIHGAGELSFWEHRVEELLKIGSASGKDVRQTFTEVDHSKLSELAMAYLELFASYRLAEGKVRVTDKMPGNFLHLGLIHATFPNAKIIYCSRHPIDNALSIYFLRFRGTHPYAYDLDDLKIFVEEQMRLRKHWLEAIPSNRIMEVRYSDMVADSSSVTRRMLEFLDLPWDDACLEYYKLDRPVRTASKWQVRQPIYNSSIGRWEHYKEYLAPLMPLLTSEISQHPQSTSLLEDNL